MTTDINVHVFTADCAPVPPAEFVAALLRTGFSPEAYRDAFGDLRALGMNATDALAHYLRYGIEDRHAPIDINGEGLIALDRLPIDNADLKAQLLTTLWGYLHAGFEHPFDQAIAARWPVIGQLASARPYFLAGDSHSSHYAMTGRRGGAWLLPLHIICHGGSARGLGNPASRSGYGEHLRQIVRTLHDLPGAGARPFLLQFGQVDIEFVHHFHRVRDGQSSLDLGAYRAFCDTTMERYVRFVTDLFEPARRRNVFLISVFPPAMSDDAWRAGHLNDDIVRRETDMPFEQLTAGIRALDVASLRQRTEIHGYCMQLLRAAARQHGFSFVDSFTPFLGADGLADPQYMLAEGHGFEHHLDSRRTRRKLEDLLWEIMLVVG